MPEVPVLVYCRLHSTGGHNRAVFVSFEGPEGAGKSTAIQWIAQELRLSGRSVLTTREPGAGAFGQRIRSLLLDGDPVTPRAEPFLFLADRAQHVATIVRPALERGELVLCDRFADSTTVYQGYGRGFDVASLREWNWFATGGLMPDLTLLFDLEPEIGLARLQNMDRLDAEPIDFHRRVRNGFLEEAAREPSRWQRLDASRSPEQVAQEALANILSRLGQP